MIAIVINRKNKQYEMGEHKGETACFEGVYNGKFRRFQLTKHEMDRAEERAQDEDNKKDWPIVTLPVVAAAITVLLAGVGLSVIVWHFIK